MNVRSDAWRNKGETAWQNNQTIRPTSACTIQGQGEARRLRRRRARNPGDMTPTTPVLVDPAARIPLETRQESILRIRLIRTARICRPLERNVERELPAAIFATSRLRVKTREMRALLDKAQTIPNE